MSRIYFLLAFVVYSSQIIASTNQLKPKVDNDFSKKLEISRQLSEKDPIQAIAIAKEYLDSAQKNKNTLLEAEARHSMGIALRKLGRYNSALDQIKLAAQIFSEHKLLEKLASAYNTMGLIRSSQGKYSASLELHINALNIRREINDEFGIAISYNNIGNSYRNTGDLQKSIEFLNQAIEKKNKLDKPQSLAYSYNNLGHTYRKMKDYANARKYYTKALEIRTEIDNKSGIASSLNNIGTLLQIENKLETALQNYQKSLTIRQEIGDKVAEVGSLNNIGSVLSELRRDQEALNILFKALTLSESIDSPVITVETLLFISNAYERMGSFELSLKYHKQYFEHHSKLFNETNSKYLMDIQADFGTKENELKIKHLQDLAQAEKESRTKEKKLYAAFALLILLVFILLIHRYQFIMKSRNEYQKLYGDLEVKTALLAKANESLAILSQIDSLTGLHNRRVFDERLEKSLRTAKRNKEPISLLMIDIDYFKNFNDEFGHQSGDFALQQVATELNKVARRPEDAACRYGGEEFAVILANTPEQGATDIATAICNNIASIQIKAAQNTPFEYLTVSIGVTTTIPSSNTAPESVVAKADNALYIAKAKGKNRAVHVN